MAKKKKMNLANVIYGAGISLIAILAMSYCTFINSLDGGTAVIIVGCLGLGCLLIGGELPALAVPPDDAECFSQEREI